MISLTFGEQVKIVLSRKGMTIKELAGQIEEKTGKKMSRQNLTQRLGRDNFQEQDMRMIADILGCSFQLSILATAEAAEKASVIEEELPTRAELHRLETKKARKEARREARREEKAEETERDITIGEFVDMMRNPVPEMEEEPEEAVSEEAVEVTEVEAAEVPEETASEETETEHPVSAEETVYAEEKVYAEETVSGEAEPAAAEDEGTKDKAAADEVSATPAAGETEAAADRETSQEWHGSERRGGLRGIFRKKEKPKDFEPIKKRTDLEEDMEHGDINPYTGHEYQSNSVRMHPKRIGYVQVYDRRTHKWTDMTEWAFLGVEENKKAKLGKDYEPPIYLD